MSDRQAESPGDEVPESAQDDTIEDSQDDGVGWLPAVLAFGLLLTAALFVCCGVSTYFLYQKRVELAARTLSGHTIPTVEQSQLEPEDKQAIVEMLGRVVEDAEAGRLENWQASGVMNRLTRIPLLEWGDLAAVEALMEADDGFDPPAKQDATTQLARLRKAITSGTATSFDVNEVVAPVLVEDQSLRGRSLASSPTTEQLQEVVTRARLVADRDEISETVSSSPSIVELVRREIEAGRIEGSK